MAETLCGLLPVVEPEGLAPYIDAARNVGLPPDICATDSGFLGCVLEEVMPPVDMVVTPTTPCDSASAPIESLTRSFIEAPVFYCEMPYWHDGRGVELYSRHIWKMIRRIEEVLGTKMDWDRCRSTFIMPTKPWSCSSKRPKCEGSRPVHTRENSSSFSFCSSTSASGTPYFRDICRFIAEDAKRLVAAKKGVLEEEKVRLLLYNPDPVYDVEIHDWLEDEYKAITALTFSVTPRRR